ncbi:hypothetical protein ES705_23333 [subsurface metagenome]
MEQVELSSFDLRYENCRMKSRVLENILLGSISEYAIRDPLQGVDTNEVRILLDGFKRYRCAKRLGIGIVPYSSLGDDEALGIIELLRLSNSKSISILEQAKLIDELMTTHNMSNWEIASLLEKSKSWVSVRSGIIGEMSVFVRNKIFSGKFPVYSYMYTLRQFMRINCVTKKDVDEFVNLVSGKNLSLRDIELLAHGYFKGSEEFRQQIKSGNISWGLSRLRESSAKRTTCTELERRMLNDLEITQKYMQRVTYRSKDTRFKTNSFYSQANLLSGGIVRQMDAFTKAIGEFHDRSGQTQSHLLPS